MPDQTNHPGRPLVVRHPRATSWRPRLALARRAGLLALLLCLAFTLAAPPARTQAAEAVLMPFEASAAVRVIQGYNGGTHQGRSRLALDLVLADGGTAYAPVLAPIGGRVGWSSGPGGGNGCVTLTAGDGSVSVMLCHIVLDRAFARGEGVTQGQRLGFVGPSGAVGNNGTPHVHMELHRGPSANNPIPFSAPEGQPLDGAPLPATGRYNEHAGPARYTSSNGAPGQRFEPTSRGGSRSGDSAGDAPASAPSAATAVVAGTNSCLNARAEPNLGAARVRCLPDGTRVTIVGDQVEAGGYSWRQLEGIGWAVTTYLRPAN